MTSPPPFLTGGRFRMELRAGNNGAHITWIPYRNLQGTWFLGDQGCNISFDTNFRGLGLTMATCYPGKTEVWIWDSRISGFPIFAGPITQMTPTSNGTMSVQASDPLWYLSRRLLLSQTSFTGKPEAAISSLLTTTQAAYSLNTTVVTHSAGTQNVSAMYASGDLPQISDLLQDLQDMGDGVDYYFRNDGISYARQLHLWAGKKTTTKTLALVYPGGALKSYALQLIGTGLGNIVYVVGSGTGLTNYGIATSVAKIAEYANEFMYVEDANQNTTATLNKQATTILKKKQSAIQIPSIVIKSDVYNPFVDFDLADQFLVKINDDYVQYSQTSRAVGWQCSFSANDDVVTVIYTNNTEEVT